MQLLSWFLLAMPLAVDVFAAGLVFGLAGLERARWLRVALGFAAIGGVVIGAGILLGDALEGALGTAALYVAAAVLLVIGLRAIHHGVRGDGAAPSLDTRRIAATALAVAVDKLAIGLSFAVLDAPLAAMIVIVAAQAFVATLLGLALGRQAGGKAGDAAEIIAGVVFTALALIVLAKAVTGSA